MDGLLLVAPCKSNKDTATGNLKRTMPRNGCLVPTWVHIRATSRSVHSRTPLSLTVETGMSGMHRRLGRQECDEEICDGEDTRHAEFSFAWWRGYEGFDRHSHSPCVRTLRALGSFSQPTIRTICKSNHGPFTPELAYQSRSRSAERTSPKRLTNILGTRPSSQLPSTRKSANTVHTLLQEPRSNGMGFGKVRNLRIQYTTTRPPRMRLGSLLVPANFVRCPRSSQFRTSNNPTTTTGHICSRLSVTAYDL